MGNDFKRGFTTYKLYVRNRVSDWLISRPYLRFAIVSLIILPLVVFITAPILNPTNYSVVGADRLLPAKNTIVAKNISYNTNLSAFKYEGQKNADGVSRSIEALFHKDASKGITITDTVNKIDFSLTPKDAHHKGRQDSNRIIYPIKNIEGWTVYTIQPTGIKEDIILEKSNTDTQTFSYHLDLGDELEAKTESDGGLGVYGNTITSSDITAATDSDTVLLQKMRKAAKKDTLLFKLPAPIVIEHSGSESEFARSHFELEGETLRVVTTGLKRANFPLSIDPSIYVMTARDFMAGNNETNIDFNVDEQLIQKSPTTGARFDDWKSTLSLPVATSANGVAATGGYIYSIGGYSHLGQAFNTQGPDTFIVPDGITSISVKAWGAGGAGGGGGNTGTGGTGGGGGYVAGNISVTPGETLTIYVGGGGKGGSNVSAAGSGGGGGGFSSIYRGSTPLLIAAGGGGGGGSRSATTGADGGAGGGTSGQAGATNYNNNGNGGGGGTQSSGGTAGSSTNNSGTAGLYLEGGLGADGRSATSGADGGGGFGGLESGGNGGLGNVNTTRAAGGGGGAGRYGGGGGGGTSSTNNSSGGGGGGGSSYTSGMTGVTNTAGNRAAPGNTNESIRNGASEGGAGGERGQGGDDGANGAIFISYGSGTEVSKNVSWAEFNTNTGAVQPANPGSGTCAGWCSSNDYALPAARTNLSLVAYNGYLYAMGGKDASGNPTNTVYIAKIGANGEPSLWHPTNTNPNSWVYWYQDTNLSSPRSDFTANAYNGRLYLIGGRTNSGSGLTSSVQMSDISPTGTLGPWTTSTTLPSNIYGHGATIYNDRLYVLGGSTSVGGAPQTAVRYNKINADGSLNNWVNTTPLPEGRFTGGGTMAAVWGAYLYVSGGCGAVNSSGYCTSVRSDIELASINADGSLDTWNTVGTASDERLGGNLIAWRGHLYRVGGCVSQNTSNGDCGQNTMDLINYGKINRDGDASTTGESSPQGQGRCTGSDPSQCNLPGQSYIGNMLTNSYIHNGYLYITGGCTNNTCSTTSRHVIYAAIDTDGSITRPDTCPDGSFQGGSWCYISNSLPTRGVAASSPVIFGDRVYLVGGLSGGSTSVNTILRAEFNEDGSFTPWESQSLSGVGGTSVSYSYAYARANPSSVSSTPGNLFIFGGCTTASNAGCTAYTQNVFKCNIAASDGAISGCSTSGQLQVGTVPGANGTGIGIMSGTVYANYIYLIGGVAPNVVDMKTVRYAKFDNNNNVVAVPGSSGWLESPNQMQIGRRRTTAFGYNGYIYVAGGFEAGGSGVVPDIEFIKVNVSDGSLGTETDGFTMSEVKINQRWGLTIAVSNSFAYVIGGCDVGDSPSGCTSRTDMVQTFQVYNNVSGAPAGYSSSTNRYSTNPNRLGGSSAILNGRIYTAGGCVSATDCTDSINTVSHAAIDVNGNLGTWTNTSASLPADRSWGKLLTAGGSLYYIGGQSDNATDYRGEIYYATPTSNGNITSWGTAASGLPQARTKFGAASWNNRLYVIGGEGTGSGCSGGVCNNVFVSPQLNSGGNISGGWSSASSPINVGRSGVAATAYANNLYIFGGYDGTGSYHSDSQYAQINASNGQVGNWTFSTSLPMPTAFANAFGANGYIYLVGGRSDNTTCEPTTLVAPVSANTTIATGNNPTGIGAWYSSNQHFSGNRYGASSVYHDGKMYVLGGACLNKSDFPTISSITTTDTGAGFASDNVNHPINLPNSTSAGDLLLLFFSYDSNGNPTASGPAGWVEVVSQNSANNGVIGSVWAKIATGSDGSTANFTTSNAQSAAAQVYRIPANRWYGDINNGIAVATGSGSTTNSPNPPSLTVPWGSDSNLWIAYAAGGTHTSITTYPAGYSNGIHVNGNTGTNGASVATARLESETATEDPGTFRAGQSQTGIPFTVAVRPAPASMQYTGADEIQQSALLSQPQVARYSILMDTDTDVYPNAWLMNGIDNSVGASWQLRYRSMTNPTTYCTSPAMTNWGQETIFGNVTLGTPGVYIPKNASGVNTNCARYFFFNVSVDSSQAYGYPDDVERGPTIDSLILQFTGDPSKRLMHGRTFTGGLQQPIDTPYYSQ